MKRKGHIVNNQYQKQEYIETFSLQNCHSMNTSDPLIFVVFSWGNYKNSDNGQDIEY